MRIAIITGASSGMGYEFCKQIPKLYRHLDELWIIARTEEKLLHLKHNLEKAYDITVRYFLLDLSDKHTFDEFENKLSSCNPNVRMLVNAAGIGKIGNICDIDRSVQSNMIDVNCSALVNMIPICMPYFTPGSRIINIASASAFSPQPGFAVYAATKAFAYSYSRALEAELKDFDVIVTVVCPGPVDTDFFKTAGEIKESKKALLAKPENVVKQALLDSKRKKSVSIYGMAMKTSRIASSILPDKFLMNIMKLINN